MTRWFVYEWGKPNGKNPTEWFSGHHSWNSTIITTCGYKQGIPSTLPTYSWTLTPRKSIVRILSFLFWCMAPKYVTNQLCGSQYATSITNLKRLLDTNFFHTMKIRKMLGHKTLRCKYTATSPRKRWSRSRTLPPVTICLNKVCWMLVQLVYRLTALKTILLYV